MSARISIGIRSSGCSIPTAKTIIRDGGMIVRGPILYHYCNNFFVPYVEQWFRLYSDDEPRIGSPTGAVGCVFKPIYFEPGGAAGHTPGGPFN